jgi:integrase
MGSAMSIRKREWKSNGTKGEAWIVDYFSNDPKTGKPKRHIKSFKTKGAAREWWDLQSGSVRRGTHTAESQSINVRQAAEDWLKAIELENREQSTLAQYRQHVTFHINPLLGDEKLAKLTAPAIKRFRDQLLERDVAKGDGKLSRSTAKKVLQSLKALIKDAHQRGNVAQNVATGITVKMDKRTKAKLEIGRDIPSRAEVRALIEKAEGRWRPLIVTAALTGLRASELRGLTWADVDFDARTIRVRQRADRYNVIGPLKSDTSRRDIPMSPEVVTTLREWKLRCPKHREPDAKKDDPGKLWLVFPNGDGNIESHGNLHNRCFIPLQITAGVTVNAGKRDADGMPMVEPKYGLHGLRHFYASWLINRKQDGGMELPAKIVQNRLGHSTIQITLDLYSHLFPAHEDHFQELADAERALLA